MRTHKVTLDLRLQKHYGKDCVDSFLNEMLPTEIYMKIYFKNEIKRNPNSIPQDYDENADPLSYTVFLIHTGSWSHADTSTAVSANYWWLQEKVSKSTKRCSKCEKLWTHSECAKKKTI